MTLSKQYYIRDLHVKKKQIIITYGEKRLVPKSDVNNVSINIVVEKNDIQKATKVFTT